MTGLLSLASGSAVAVTFPLLWPYTILFGCLVMPVPTICYFHISHKYVTRSFRSLWKPASPAFSGPFSFNLHCAVPASTPSPIPYSWCGLQHEEWSLVNLHVLKTVFFMEVTLCPFLETLAPCVVLCISLLLTLNADC